MPTLVAESLTDDIPYHVPYPVPLRVGVGPAIEQAIRRLRMWRLTDRNPRYSHDRTIVTVIVLLCGTVLLFHYGDSSPIVALVSAGWTLALTFWFRFNADPESGDK